MPAVVAADLDTDTNRHPMTSEHNSTDKIIISQIQKNDVEYKKIKINLYMIYIERKVIKL